MDDKLLLIPGPTNLSPRVRETMAGQELPHVGSQFYSLFKETVALARYVFRNEKGVRIVFTRFCFSLAGVYPTSNQTTVERL